MTREELLKELGKIPKVETNNPISTMNVINVDDLMNAVDRLNKIPDYNDLLKENQELKKQVEYLRSGEYLNQLKFERDILQDIVDNGKILKEDKEFIDMTHRNTELLEENQELKKQLEVPETCNLKTLEDYKSYYEDTTKEQILADTYIEYCAYVNLAHRYSELEKQLEVGEEQYNDLVQEKEELQEQLSSKTLQLEELKKQVEELNRFKFSCKKDETQMPATIYNKKIIEDISKIKSQQKAFIKYLEDEIERKRLNATCTTGYNDYVIPLKHVLRKYKEIIGVNDESR